MGVQPSGDFVLLLLGVIVAFIAVCLAAFVETLKNRQLAEKDSAGCTSPEAGLVAGETSERREVSTGPSLVRKLAVCIIGGILMGLWNPLVTFAEKDPGLSAYGELTFFTLSTLISSLVLIPVILKWPLEGGPSTTIALLLREYPRVPAKAHLWSVAGGIIWCVGTLANAVAGSSKVLSSAESYAIGQCANMIAILWGLFYFKEFDGTDWKVKGLLGLVCFLYAGAIVLIAASSK